MPESSFQLPDANTGGSEDEQPDDDSDAAERIEVRSDEDLDQRAASQLDRLRDVAEQNARRELRVALCEHRVRKSERFETVASHLPVRLLGEPCFPGVGISEKAGLPLQREEPEAGRRVRDDHCSRCSEEEEVLSSDRADGRHTGRALVPYDPGSGQEDGGNRESNRRAARPGGDDDRQRHEPEKGDRADERRCSAQESRCHRPTSDSACCLPCGQDGREDERGSNNIGHVLVGRSHVRELRPDQRREERQERRCSEGAGPTAGHPFAHEEHRQSHPDDQQVLQGDDRRQWEAEDESSSEEQGIARCSQGVGSG